jgi:hypothetical protein
MFRILNDSLFLETDQSERTLTVAWIVGWWDPAVPNPFGCWIIARPGDPLSTRSSSRVGDI